jgi:hypothetical protein
VEIDKFFIKEKLNNDELELGHVATKEQVADCLTKDLVHWTYLDCVTRWA